MRQPTFYAWLSVATAVVTIALKFAAWYITGSVGLLSDAIEGVVNIVAAVVALAVLTYSAAKPDHEHNFGHEKAQYFSSGIEGALIFVAAAGIFWSALPRLVDPRPVEQLGLGVLLSVLATAANAACAWLLLKAASEHRSITLEADARHLLTDVWTTLGVLVGVGLAMASGWLWLDPLVAIAVGLQILWTGWHLMRRSFDGLMDFAIPAEELEVVIEVMESLRHQGGDYHALRTRVSGAKSFVDVHVLLPGGTTIQAGHDLAEELEKSIQARLPHIDVLTHLEPLEDPKSWDDPRKPLAGS